MQQAARLMIAGAAAMALGACAAGPPERGGDISKESGLYGEYRNLVEVVTDPPDAGCTLKSGSAEGAVADVAPRIVTLSVRSGSPATITCRMPGFAETSRTIESLQVLGPGYIPVMAVISFAGATSAAVTGRGLRFQPIVIVVLKPEGDGGDLASWRATKRDFVTERWNAFFSAQRERCAENRLNRDCRSADVLKPYIDADLSAL